jgi:hypothetical protein
MAGRDDRGSLPLAMLLTVIAVGATVLLSNVVVPQIRNTGTDVRKATEINTAQAGIEAALGQIRGTVRAGDGTGDRTALPCTSTAAGAPDATLTGPVSEGGAAAYSVQMYYLPSRPPTDGTQAQWAKANRLPCTIGGGTSVAPDYALLISTGTAVARSAGRTLTATYQFQSRTKANVPGGAISVYNSSLCFAAPKDVGGGDPLKNGDQLVLVTCAAGDPLQSWAYGPDLHVTLLAADGLAAYPTGLCLQANSTDHAVVTFAGCDDTLRTQIWSLNNRDNFEGTTDGMEPNGKCFNVDYSTSPPSMVINNVIPGNPNAVVNSGGSDGTPCSGTSGDYTDYKAFFPDAKAGTGAAGPQTGQLVDYEQFGRCLDVTANTVTYDFMVIFPCKQRPAGDIQWNQVWHLPPLATGQSSADGRIYTHSTQDGEYYCLYSPGSTAPERWVKVEQCTPSDAIPADERWTRRDATGDNTDSYRLESTYGTGSPFCLQPTEPGDLNGYWNQFTAMKISKLVLLDCDASNAQKWNASPSVLSSVIKDFREN